MIPSSLTGDHNSEGQPEGEREQVRRLAAADKSFSRNGRGLHFTGNSAHSNGDVLLCCGVQIFSPDGDHSSSSCWTLCWVDPLWFGVLTGIIDRS